MKFTPQILIIGLLLGLSRPVADAATITNLAYRVDSTGTAAVIVTEVATGASATFQPNFYIMYSATSPGYDLYDSTIKVTEYGVAGFYPMVWSNSWSFFSAPGADYRVTASTNSVETNTFHWIFTGTNGIAVDARITMPAGTGEPILSFQMTTAGAGYYTIGYVGAPERTTSQVDWMWQPAIWHGKRFPSTSFLTAEFECELPAVLNGYSNQTVGLAVDPASLYSPYNDANKDLQDSTSNQPGGFGVVLRNASGNLQPMVFAPVYGYASLAAGANVSLTVRLVARQGDWYSSYKYLARSLYGFTDYRTNSLCSLNTTVDTMQDFLQNYTYSHWLPRYKAWDYVNDKPGWARQQSASDAISLALVKDDLSLFTNIARPTLEYMLSRTGTLFPQSDTNDPPNSAMGGWITSAYGGSDLASVYQLSGKRCTVVSQLVQPTLQTTAVINNLGSMKTALAELLSNYRITGNVSYLNAARTTATNYIALRINQQPTGAADSEGSFFPQISPTWNLMNEMYDETGDPVYRDSFVRGIQQFTTFNYLIPASGPTNITVPNYLTGGNDSVPAWRVDPRGLMREACATMHSHVGIFMPPFASYMLRAGSYTNDSFLTAIGRAAVVGRYQSYPGYAYRKQLTHSYEKTGWPLQDYSVIRQHITMHYNHPLPMTTYLLEFLVADAGARSGDAIKWPSGYSWTGAYFQHKVYGMAPGVFYGDTNVFLWMPKGLVTNSSVQINYVSGYGNGNFYLALMNQCSNAVTTQIGIKASAVSLAGTHGVRLITDNVAQPATSMVDGTMTVGVSGMGITALVVSNAPVTTALQSLCYEPNPVALPTGCYKTQSSTPVGDVAGQLLSFGTYLTSAFVWVDYDTNNLTQATLRYETNGVWQTMLDTDFPFEFTVPLPDNRTSFRFYVEGRTPAGTTVSNSPLQLGYQLSIQSPQGPGSAPAGALYNFNQSVTASVPSSVTANGLLYACTGWSMTGNSPATGTLNSVTFAITNDATIAWQWQAVPMPTVDNMLGATGVTFSTAWLNGSLTATGRAPTTVSIHWGASDGGTNKNAWFNSISLGTLPVGPFTAQVTGLHDAATYYYRCCASNADAEVWAPASAVFTTPLLTGNTRSKMTVAFPNYTRLETLTNFPVLLVLSPNVGGSGFSYTSFVSTNGYDLRFWDAAEVQGLNYEIEEWNANGSSYVWVQVPQLSSNTVFRVSWGDGADCDQLACTTNGATWGGNFEAVWHLNEDPGVSTSIHDSTANQHDGTSGNLLSIDQMPGLSGGSLSFDGSTKFIALNSELVMSESNGFTFSAWVRPLATATAYPGVTARAASPGYNDSLRLFNGTPRLNINGSGKLYNTPTVMDGATWTYLAGTRAGGSPGIVTLFQNGTNDTSSASNTTTNFNIAYLGRGTQTNDTSRNWKGGLDEIRVSSVARSTNWIWAEWLNTRSNGLFNSYGTVTSESVFLLSAVAVSTNLIIRWPGVSNATYDVERAFNLTGGFWLVASNLPATPPVNTFTDNLSDNPGAFYRVRSK